MVKARTLIALGVLGGVVYFLVRKASAAPPCQYLTKTMEYYYFTYVGLAQTFKAALGECYDVIYTIDVWDPMYGEYNPPVDPVHDIIEPDCECRVMVIEPCEICGFSPSSPISVLI